MNPQFLTMKARQVLNEFYWLKLCPRRYSALQLEISKHSKGFFGFETAKQETIQHTFEYTPTHTGTARF